MTSTRAHRLLAALCLGPLTGLPTQAQTAPATVQVYGQATAGVIHRNNQVGGGTLNELGNSLLAASVLGLRGSEDLGGGMSALFRLEHGLNMDTGAASSAKFWNRQAFVGLNLGPAATLTLGRQFHAGADRAIQSLDVYNLGGTSVLSTPLGLFGVNRFSGNDTRVDNSAKLRLRGPFGLTAGVSGGLREETGRSLSADVAQITPRYVIAAYGIRFRALTPVASTGLLPTHEVWAVGGQLPLGSVRLYFQYVNSTLDATVAGRRRQDNQILAPGVSWQASNEVVLKAAYTHDKGTDLNGIADRNGTKKTAVLSAEYFLSKRSSLNAVLFSNQYTGGYKLETVNIAAMGRDPAASSVQGLSVGVRHDF